MLNDKITKSRLLIIMFRLV